MDRPAGHLLGPFFEAPSTEASFATRPADSRGRLYPEAESATRTCYQRDRDRLIHSAAFRRLKHKTQVFVEHEGDYHRTRMTHSLEVAQIARSIARVFAVDEDLAEALALAHDLGHTPFGHSGETALNRMTEAFGGFDHNAHALRLVTKLEHRYADFDGLNLTWETLEGLVKHNGPIAAGVRPIPAPIVSFDARMPLELSTWPGFEAQIAALSDDIAYVTHDIDDGLRAHLFSIADLAEAPLAGPCVRTVTARYGDLELGRFIGELARLLMSEMIGDVFAETRARLAAGQPQSAAAVRARNKATVSFSNGMTKLVSDLKDFLFARMYRHPRVTVTNDKAQEVVESLFDALSGNPALLPADWAASCGAPRDAVTAGVVRDYIAGMTDRYALQEYARIFRREIML
ncbi:MAG: deoxyguanosinetriphosphate triphosphohydrolase [Alphaproteobacteria bacterium]|nr:deoxyguanosinetriphosphate triphosphohydrolase [Alphaproteobacteria bacterium]